MDYAKRQIIDNEIAMIVSLEPKMVKSLIRAYEMRFVKIFNIA